MTGVGCGAVAARAEQQVAGLDLGQRDDGAVLLPLVGGAGDVEAGGGVGGVDQAGAVIRVRAGRPPLVGLAELGHREGDPGGGGRDVAAALGGVPGGPRHHLADVPLGVVVGEDRVLQAGRAAAAGAVRAEHRGGGVDGIGRVVGAERLAGVGVDRELGEGGGLELHGAFGSGAVGAGADAGQGGAAVAGYA